MNLLRALVATGALCAGLGLHTALAFRGDYPPAPPVGGCDVAADPVCTSPVRPPIVVSPPPPPPAPPACEPFYGRHC